MDTASAVIGIILMILFVGPVAYVIWQQAAKDRKKLQQLKIVEQQNGLHLDQVELTPSLLLGLDSANKKLVVVNSLKGNEQQVIDLANVYKSQLKKSANPDNTGGKSAITHVSLELLNGRPGNTTQIIFYDEEEDTGHDMATQLSLANKWELLLKPHLKS
ncbi:MAG TPA: hypothetical protein VK941_12525 [Gillisia sp.]|nr:hypothetical protein [Gillisia sp.]